MRISSIFVCNWIFFFPKAEQSAPRSANKPGALIEKGAVDWFGIHKYAARLHFVGYLVGNFVFTSKNTVAFAFRLSTAARSWPNSSGSGVLIGIKSNSVSLTSRRASLPLVMVVILLWPAADKRFTSCSAAFFRAGYNQYMFQITTPNQAS